MKFIATIMLAAATTAAPVAAQQFPSDAELASLLQGRVDERRAVGIVLGVLDADGSTRVISAGTAGEGARPLGDRTVFEIGSITKVFTGVLLAEMARRGELRLSDAVSSHLPDNVRVPSRAGKQITLLDLATHHSALPRLPNNMAPSDPTNPYADYTVAQLYRSLASLTLERDIGSSYEYSNLGTGLLGHALSLAGGASYDDLLRELVLDPLSMRATGIELDAEMGNWVAMGHDEGGNVVPRWDMPTLAGAGALRSDVRDMLRFLSANMGEPSTALERAVRTTHEPRETISDHMSIGLGWHIMSVDNSRIIWHNGGTGGFRSFIGFDPDRGVGVVLLMNSAHGADDIGFHLLNPELPLAEAPPERVEIEVATETLEDYVGEYQLAPDFSIAVTREGAALFLQATGQARFPIFAESETGFFLRAVDAQITFQRNAAGVVTGLVLHQGGQNMPGHKVR